MSDDDDQGDDDEASLMDVGRGDLDDGDRDTCTECGTAIWASLDGEGGEGAYCEDCSTIDGPEGLDDLL